ncbi:MAG: universal stress protein [Actinobacteria bacterium]|nr:universal stress protein [Actinomycetota bacterium]
MSQRTVVVGTDGSRTAEEAVRHAARIAAEHDAKLVVVTAYERHRTQEDGIDRTPGELRWLLTDPAQAEGRAEAGRDIALAEGATRVAVRAVEAKPVAALVEVARSEQADVLVVGSRGLASPAHVVRGSVASGVLDKAPCRVVVVDTDHLAGR